MEIHQLGAIVNMPYDPTKEGGTVTENIDAATKLKETEYSELLKKANNKKILMIGGAIAAAGLLYYLYKRKK